MSKGEYAGPVVLFDGVCNLCNWSVRFIIKRDPRGVFKFAPLQSKAGVRYLQKYGLPTEDFDTFILVDGAKCYVRSEAALRVARHLGGVWALLYVLIIVPKPIRDYVYGFVARHRYKWFGKTEQCMVPGPGIDEWFLE